MNKLYKKQHITKLTKMKMKTGNIKIKSNSRAQPISLIKCGHSTVYSNKRIQMLLRLVQMGNSKDIQYNRLSKSETFSNSINIVS